MKSCEFRMKSESRECVMSVMKDILSDASEVFSVVVENIPISMDDDYKTIEIACTDYDSAIAIVECLEKNAYGIV